NPPPSAQQKPASSGRSYDPANSRTDQSPDDVRHRRGPAVGGVGSRPGGMVTVAGGTGMGAAYGSASRYGNRQPSPPARVNRPGRRRGDTRAGGAVDAETECFIPSEPGQASAETQGAVGQSRSA